MTALQFLAEWALRSSILILTGTLLLWMLRVKDPSIRLLAWTAMLCGSLAIPVLTPVLPTVPLIIQRTATLPAEAPAPVSAEPVPDVGIILDQHIPTPPRPFDWQRAALIIYALVALALLLRLFVGLTMSLRLKRSGRPTGQTTEGIEIRESDRITGPVTLGIASPAIVLPADWRGWDSAKLEAVLAHERSHVQRYDPAVQLLSAVHRAILWSSPLSWFLHTRIVRTAEEASDDSALAVTRDRAQYAQVLLDFMQRGVGSPNWLGVPMARYSHPNQRIHRVLDGTVISRGVTRLSLLAIFLLGTPLAYVAAAANPQTALPSRDRKEAVTASPATPTKPVEPIAPQLIAQATQPAPNPPTPDAPPTQPLASDPNIQSIKLSLAEQVKALLEQVQAKQQQVQAQQASAYLNALGNVTAYTVTIKPRIDGQLLSVKFKEGEEVGAEQLLATIDPGSLQLQLVKAESQLAQDRYLNQGPTRNEQLKIDQAMVEDATRQLSYAQVRSPIGGVAGLRLIDPGNVVHPGDSLVVITRLHPISVVFNIAEDNLSKVRNLLKKGVTVPVIAWNRDMTAKIATGILTAIDNQVDSNTGTVKLKAEFDNQDDKLFPNQFVNIQVLLNPQ